MGGDLEGTLTADLFGELRALLAKPPGPDPFAALCVQVDRAHHAKEVVDYLLGSLSRWPDRIARQIPRNWMERLLAGTPTRGARLCNKLVCRGRQLRGESIRRVLSSRDVEGVEWLDFHGNQAGDMAAKAVASAPHLPRLLHLNLGATALGDDGVRVLAGAANLAGLKTLVLDHNRLRAKGMAWLMGSDVLTCCWAWSDWTCTTTPWAPAACARWRARGWALGWFV